MKIIQTQHELSVNKKGRRGQYISKMSVRKDKGCEECSRLKEIKETWQVNVVLDPGLDAVLEAENAI